jgi:methanogenic corrinoid protein MtbC1
MSAQGRQHAALIESMQRGLADLAVDAHFERDPGLGDRYGSMGRRVWRTEAQSRVIHLVQSVACGRPRLFASHAAWAIEALRARHVPEDEIRAHLETLAATLAAELPEDTAVAAKEHVDAAVAMLDADHGPGDGLLDDQSQDSTLSRLYLLHLLQRDEREALALVEDAMRAGMSLAQAYERVITPAVGEIGRMWHLQEASIADEHYCTSATRSIVARLRAAAPAPAPDGRRALCCSVGGDLHDLGIRMAADLLELDGWTIDFMGANMPAAEVVISIEHAAEEPGRTFDLVVASASTMLSLRAMMDLVDAMHASPVARTVPLLVGGAPFSADPGLAAALGANAAAESLSEAVLAAERLVPAAAARRGR